MSAKSTISLFFDSRAIDFPIGSQNEDLARLMPQIAQLNVWPCEDGSCGLCRVLLIGWPPHPGPVPMELCQVDINQLQGVSVANVN